jgi:hypothetical protein
VRHAIALLVLLRVVCAVVWIGSAPSPLNRNIMWGDAVRYAEIDAAEGRPYRDHEVEYPPLTVAAIEVVTPSDALTDPLNARTVIVVGLVMDLAAAAVVGWGFGRRAARTYLVVGLPVVLTGVAYLRLDLLSVALAAAGLALCRRNRPTAGGLALVAGAFAKLWPLVLLPVLAVQRRWRALGVSVAAGTLGLAAWVAYGGAAGPEQVLTLRGAAGWQVESLPASVLRIFSSEAPFNDAAAWRLGPSPGAVRWGLVAVGLGVVAAVWWTAARRRDAFGGAALSAVGALLATSAVLSPQFLLWLLPCVAVLPAGVSGDAIRRLALAATIVTFLVVTSEWEILHGVDWAVGILLARNALLVALVVAAWRLAGHAPESGQCSNDPLPAASPTPRAPISSGTPTAA